MNLSELAATRHSCKSFDPSRRISDTDLAQLKAALVNAPSSTNSQPWRFVIAGSEEGKSRIIKSMSGTKFAGNVVKVKNASHSVVLCAKKKLDDTYQKAIIDAENQAGRYAASPAFKVDRENGFAHAVNYYREQGREEEWIIRQVYIALGFLLLGAATLGIDANAMEGFDADILDQELGLADEGYTALLVVSLGYRAADDFNAKLPKSRLPESLVLAEI